MFLIYFAFLPRGHSKTKETISLTNMKGTKKYFDYFFKYVYLKFEDLEKLTCSKGLFLLLKSSYIPSMSIL